MMFAPLRFTLILPQLKSRLTMLKNLFLNLFFPRFCFGCKKEGSWLCLDCEATLEIVNYHQKHSGVFLKDLYWALPYQKPLIKKLIHCFKYEPLAKELSQNLSILIINHFQLIENPPFFFNKKSNYVLVPVPLHKQRLKWRGFNQAEEIGKELSSFLNIPLVSDCLIKNKKTPPQTNLSQEQRKENIFNSFTIKNKRKIKEKRILLVDDIFTIGATMEECAKVLKKSGAKEVVGIVIARG